MNHIIKAAKFCKLYHKDQTRKYSSVPYWVHPYRVAAETIFYEDNFLDPETAMCAAYLHDVLEDCPVSYESILQDFNPDIAAYILGLTAYSKQINSPLKRIQRKEMDLHYLEKQPKDVQLLKLLDRLDNIKELTSDKEWNNDARDFVPLYYRETNELLNRLKFDNEIWEDLHFYNNRMVD